MPALFQLPIEVLEVITDYLQTNTLSHTCKSLWTALRLRHITTIPEELNCAFTLQDAVNQVLALYPQANENTATLKIQGTCESASWTELSVPFQKLETLFIDSSNYDRPPQWDSRCMRHLIAPAMHCLRTLEIRQYPANGPGLFGDSDSESDDEVGTRLKKLNGDPFLSDMGELLKQGKSLEVFSLDHHTQRGTMNARGLRQLANGLQHHKKLHSITLNIKRCSYSTDSVVFLLSSLCVSSLCTLRLELGAFHTKAIAAIRSLLSNPHARLATLSVWCHHNDSLTDLLQAIPQSKLKRFMFETSAKNPPELALELLVSFTSGSLTELQLTAMFVTEEYHRSLASLLADWKVADFGCRDRRGVFSARRS